MNQNQTIAHRYAKALLLTVDNAQLAQAEENFAQIVEVLAKDSHMKQVLSNPAVDKFAKQKIVSVVLEKLNIQQPLTNFLLFLLRKNRLILLAQIEEAFVLLVDEKLKRLKVKLQSASKVSESLLAEIKDQLARKSQLDVFLTHEVNHELLGGLRLETANMVLDGSAKNKLNTLKDDLIKNFR